MTEVDAQHLPGPALVTGGSRGIGRAICLELARRGHDVAFFYLERDDAAQETLGAIESAGVAARAQRVDVGDHRQVSEGVGEVQHGWHGFDVLVNCAGITLDRMLHKLDEDSWRRVVGTSLDGCFNVTHALLPGMRERGYGRIVNISSIVGQSGNLGQTNYAAAKAGMIGFSKSLALETARYDITVNAVCPGFIRTDMLDAMAEESRQRVLAQIPKQRFGTPEEVALVAAFLAAPEAAFITGQQINVNGGMYL
jgi:NAD(P)-dependent dehydrogenase (short-subunit alcohol dehydrogenase family)